jgi:hypothetical protein
MQLASPRGMLRPLYIALALPIMAAGCGGGTETSTASSAPASSGGNATPPAASASATPVGPAGAAVGSVDVRLRNDTGHDVYLLVDGQVTPLWLEIDNPVLSLNGYGGQWCGAGTNGAHNDPNSRVDRLEAGASSTTTWQGTYVTNDQGCLESRYASAGKHAARACFYDTAPPLFGPLAEGATRRPSTWYSTPTRCIDFTIDVKASGSAAVDVVLTPQ